MGAFIARRLGQAVLTIIGVMIVTFLLFRAIAGDIAAAHIGARATRQQKADWRHLHGYDRPLLLNLHRRVLVTDKTAGEKPFRIDDAAAGPQGAPLAMVPLDRAGGAEDRRSHDTLMSIEAFWLSGDTPVEVLIEDGPFAADDAKVVFALSDGTSVSVDVAGVKTCAELIGRINGHSENQGSGRLFARISTWGPGQLLDSQFVDHLVRSVTFQGRSLVNNKKLTEIISERALASLAIAVPAMAIGWFVAMIVSCLVAYYRGTVLDKAGVFLSVLGMCIPYLAFMIYGQWLMFVVAPAHAYGVFYRGNLYVPILITVIAHLGGSVRFYRTVILDEIHREYVRTARAKGTPLTDVLFKHVLKNCMLPILTSLIAAIPFLVLGNLLAESYFGIPGLGDLLLTSFNGRDEPILNGLVFLTSLVYTLALLVTDLSYAVFDPRIRLK